MGWPLGRGLIAAVLSASLVGVAALAVAEPQANEPPAGFLLLRDQLGRTTRASTNDVPPVLQPPAATGPGQQVPVGPRGAPQSEDNLGLNLQYQPGEQWYAMFGFGAYNQDAGQSPFGNLTFQNWSHLLEFGLTPKDVFGLGPGVEGILDTPGLTRRTRGPLMSQGPETNRGWLRATTVS